MRPPQCFIRYLKAASDAQANLLLSQYPSQAKRSGLEASPLAVHEVDGHVLALVAAVVKAQRELDEHVRNCEECETP